MAASSLVRSLLALTCFALLLAECVAHRRHSRRSNTPNCADNIIGSSTSEVILLPDITSAGYQSSVMVDNEDHCYQRGMKLAGTLIKACDLLGSPPPSILTPSVLSQIVTCHTSGPCPNGMVISVTQFCS